MNSNDVWEAIISVMKEDQAYVNIFNYYMGLCMKTTRGTANASLLSCALHKSLITEIYKEQLLESN